MAMFFSDVLFWYHRYEFQSVEEEVMHELSTDKNGNEKKLPNSYIIREIVNHRIKKRKEKFKRLQESPAELQEELMKIRKTLEQDGT